MAIGLGEFSLARVILYLKYRDVFANLSGAETLYAFAAGLRFDMASVAVSMAIPLLLITAPSRFFQNKWVFGLGAVAIYFLVLAGGGLLIGDIVYFSFVKRHITNELMLVAGDPGYILDEAINNWPFLLLAIFLVLGGLVLWGRFLKIPTKRSAYHPVKFATFFVLLIILARGGFGSHPLAIIHAFENGNSYVGNLAMNGVFSASHTMLIKDVEREAFSDADLKEMLALPADFFERQFPLERQPAFRAGAKKRNLIILMVESLTYKYVDSFAGQDYGVTPFLDELSRQSVKFPNHYAHGQRSIIGLQSMLTGMPSVMGLPSVILQASNYSRLAAIAQNNGYRNHFIASLKRRTFLTDAIAGATGFSSYYGREDIPVLQPWHDKDRKLGFDYDTLMFTHKKINEGQGPFFSFVYASMNHTPFPKLPAQFSKYPHHQEQEGGYLNTLSYVDWSLRKFFEKCREEPWFDDTIFVIVADHALAHYQSGGLLEKFHIPLLIHAPKIYKPRTIETVSSQLDIFPTLLEMLGLEGSFSTIGENLFTKERNEALVREGSLISIITDKGYLKHSLHNRLETKSFAEPMPKAYFDQLEKRLLGWDGLAYKLLNANRWAK